MVQYPQVSADIAAYACICGLQQPSLLLVPVGSESGCFPHYHNRRKQMSAVQPLVFFTVVVHYPQESADRAIDTASSSFCCCLYQ